MNKTATNISYYIDLELLKAIDDYVKIEKERRFPERVNRSEIMSKFMKDGLDRHYPNWKYKQILKNENESS